MEEEDETVKRIVIHISITGKLNDQSANLFSHKARTNWSGPVRGRVSWKGVEGTGKGRNTDGWRWRGLFTPVGHHPSVPSPLPS